MHISSFGLIFLATITFSTNLPAQPSDFGNQFLDALSPSSERQERAGGVLREFKKAGLIPLKPQRVDYTDFYPLLKPIKIFGHDLILVEEEYMTKFIGCCVDEGAGIVLRLHGDVKKLGEFAQANKCQLTEFRDQIEYKEQSRVRFTLPSGSYASVSCRERDLHR
jgi:hypothetical protein